MALKGNSLKDNFGDSHWTRTDITIMIVAGLVVLYLGRKFLKNKKHKQYERDTVIFHQFNRGKFVPSISPFCLKLETFLRLAKIKYQTDRRRPIGPASKSPWISYNDDSIPDSTLCIDYLNKKFGVNLNAKLSAEQMAVAHAFQIMVDEHLFWCMALNRLNYDDRKEYLHQMIWQTKIPKVIFTFLLRKIVTWRAKSQGIALHSRETVNEFAKRDLKSLSDYLGKNNFLFGSEATEADCAVFGMVAQLYWTAPASAPFKKWFEGDFQNLASYCNRMKNLAYPDWDDCLEKRKI